MKRLCIIPCGSKKIWRIKPYVGVVEAKHVYLSSFHQACQKYAETFFDCWIILSAKHGFLFPSDPVSGDYDTTFKNRENEVISIAELKVQAEQKGLFEFDEITVLAGKDYSKVIKQVFQPNYNLRFPLKGCKGIGLMHQRINQSLERNREWNSECLVTIIKK